MTNPLQCKYIVAVEGHVVRCGLGRWGGFPSAGVCAACFAGSVTENLDDGTAWPPRTDDECRGNEATCMACNKLVDGEICWELQTASNRPCAGCRKIWLNRNRAVDCPLHKWLPPPVVVFPGISCYMPTRALPPGMHNEAVACFLEQDYAGPKELAIYNNDPALALVFDHPEVTVINESRNGRTLGQLFNSTIAECRYDLLACWEDDDIRLPSHLSRMFAALGDAGAVRPRHYWYLEKDTIKEWSANGPAHSAWLLRRAALAAAGGYPADKSTDCDYAVWAALEKAGPVRTWDCQPAEATFLYRWAGGSVHLSGFGVGDDVMDSADAVTLYLQDRGEAIKGSYRIEPALSCDYAQLVNTYIKEHPL